MKLLGLGDSVMDAYLFQNQGYPGGNALNVSVLARRAGAETAGYLGVLADDAPGKHMLHALSAEGVDTGRVRIAHGATAMNYISLGPDGDRQFTGNNGCDTVQNCIRPMLTLTDRTYISGFDVTHSSIHSLLDDELPALAAHTRLSMDFSNDGFTHVNVARLAPLLRFAFFSAGGRDDAAVADFAHYAAAQGVPTVVFTMGARGAYILDHGETYRQPVIPTEAVDTLGAGDAFIAAFLVRYTQTDGDVPESAAFAARFAADSCRVSGAFGHPYPL